MTEARPLLPQQAGAAGGPRRRLAVQGAVAQGVGAAPDLAAAHAVEPQVN